MKLRVPALPDLFISSFPIFSARRSDARYLNSHWLISGPGEMRDTRRFGVETARSESFEFLFIEMRAVTDVPGSRNHCCYAIIGMRVCLDFGVCRNGQVNRVQARLLGIAFQYTCLDTVYSGCSRACAA